MEKIKRSKDVLTNINLSYTINVDNKSSITIQKFEFH